MSDEFNEALYIDKYQHAKLDTILKLKEPERTYAIRGWVAASEVLVDPMVKIKSASGKLMEVCYGNQRLVIPPAGRRVTRRVALRLLQDYGEDGIYRGKNQASGFDTLSWNTFRRNQPEMVGVYAEDENGNMSFIEDYLTHVPRKSEPVPSNVPILGEAEDDVVVGEDE